MVDIVKDKFYTVADFIKNDSNYYFVEVREYAYDGFFGENKIGLFERTEENRQKLIKMVTSMNDPDDNYFTDKIFEIYEIAHDNSTGEEITIKNLDTSLIEELEKHYYRQ